MKTNRLPYLMLIGSLLAASTGCGGGYYEDGKLFSEDGAELDLGSSSEDLSTAFSGTADGLKFNNSFKNVVIFDVTTGGLCGGMVYTALDYFYDAKALPRQDYRPAVGYTLRDYLYTRQVDSLERNLDKWAELGFNPFGARNSEFWRWGLQKTGRVAELRKALDAGKPVPLGLQSCAECEPGNHQVLAIGYELGAYDSALLGYPNLKIRIYDPSYPAEERTLITDKTSQRWYDAQNSRRRWLTYFVDANYTKSVPPTASTPSRGLLLTLTTGGDDLRGGNDNVNVKVTFNDGSTQTFSNVNRGGRWINDSTEQVAVSLASPASVKSVTLTTTFGGGIGGDNWNLNRIRVHEIDNYDTKGLRADKSGSPVKRFTGDDKSYTVNL